MWELDERSGERETCCYLLMDVNKFKKVNDTYGHVTGDEVLRLVAEQLKRTFGNMQAFLARYGGDEFVVIVKGKTQDEMDVIIHQTQENVNAIAWGADTPWQLSISIGCAMRGEQGKQKAMNCWRLRMSACTARKRYTGQIIRAYSLHTFRWERKTEG